MTRPFSSSVEPEGTRKSEDLYERLRRLEDMLSKSPFLRGRLLTEDPLNERAVKFSGIELVIDTPKTLPHGLNRRMLGFQLVWPVSPTNTLWGGALYPISVGSRPNPTTLPLETHFTLVSSYTQTVYLWVF